MRASMSLLQIKPPRGHEVSTCRASKHFRGLEFFRSDGEATLPAYRRYPDDTCPAREVTGTTSDLRQAIGLPVSHGVRFMTPL